MSEKEKYEHTFSVEVPGYLHRYSPVTIRYVVGADATLVNMIEAFELFLKGIGYVFPKGMHLGYEEDEDLTPSEDWDDLDTNNGYPLSEAPPASEEDTIKDKPEKNNLI
jgi:hypothetical protein